MKQYYADRHAQHILQTAVPAAALLLILLLWYFLIFLPRWLLWLLTFLLAAVTVFLSAFWLPLWFESVTYTISTTHIAKRCGIFFQQEQIMRTQSLQYSTVIYAPISRKTGLNFIPLHAYGGSVLLAFLSRTDAEEIQAFLQRTVYHQAQYDPVPPSSDSPHTS